MSTTSRRQAREFALRVLYAYEMTHNPIDLIFHDLLMGKLPDENSRQFSKELVRISVEHGAEFDEVIRMKALNWDFSRIAVLDKVILRLGLCELVYFADIPPKVTINEAIEIAKKYSTEKSGLFINGILDSVLQELRESGRLKKSGRGLLEI